jgi:hypothetical protein
MDLRNLTDEEFLMLAEEEAKASINIGRRPHPSAFPGWKPDEAMEVPSVIRVKAPQLASSERNTRKAS